VAQEQNLNATQSNSEIRITILRLLMINIVLPIVIYSIAKDKMSDVAAIALSGIPPALDALYSIIRHRRIDIISTATVVAIALSGVVAAFTKDAKLLLVKDSFVTLMFGITHLSSIIFGKENLIWSYNRQFNGSSPEDQARLDELWSIKNVQSVTNTMCVVWGLGLFLEGILRIVLIYNLPVSTMGYLSPILVAVVFTILGLWNVIYIKMRICMRSKFINIYISLIKD